MATLQGYRFQELIYKIWLVEIAEEIKSVVIKTAKLK